MTLTAPFPYFGGKRRLAASIWRRLGNPGVYVEPCAGSIACLLARPGGAGPREIISDTDGGVCNFWRATEFGDPEEVAYWVDYPTIHQDLTARHRWLSTWIAEHSSRLSEDPEFYDVKAAGWWAWGISLWIGGGWCRDTDGRGRSERLRAVSDKRPFVHDRPGGPGVSAQRDKIPHVSTRTGGRGVSAQRSRRNELVDWFTALRARLAGVIVLNRSWEAALTPTMLQHTSSGPKPTVGVMLDPPYRSDERAGDIYQSDRDGTSDVVAAATWQWAQQHGDKYRVAYCCHEGDVVVPDGWDAETTSVAGITRPDRRHRRDMVVFSPACLSEPQGRLFSASAEIERDTHDPAWLNGASLRQCP